MWRVRSPIKTPPRSFIGEMVDRIGGDGPRRAKIADIDATGTRIVGRDGSWPVSDYAVVDSSPLVRERYGTEILTALQIASGSLTQSKRKNLYAVKDRFTAADASGVRRKHRLRLADAQRRRCNHRPGVDRGSRPGRPHEHRRRCSTHPAAVDVRTRHALSQRRRRAWKGLNQYGPFDNSRVTIHEKSILFVFPRTLQPLAAQTGQGP